MRVHTIVAGFVFTACLAACQSDGTGISKEHARHEAGSVPGLVMELRELVDGDVHRHAPDAALPDRKQEVDTRSTLRLTFDVPPDQRALAASPEWQQIKAALEGLKPLLEEYRAISALAAELPEHDFEGTAEFQTRVKAFAKSQQALTNSLVSTEKRAGLFSRAEFTALVMSRADLWKAFDERLTRELAVLEQRSKAFTAREDDVLVTVRARLEPEVGPPQWLQVPGYWESQGEDPVEVERASSAELRKLRAEFAAAQDVAAMIRELRESGSLVFRDLNGLLDAFRADLERRWRELVDRRTRMLATVLDAAPADRTSLGADERAFWEAVDALSAGIEASEQRWRPLIEAAKDGTLVERADELVAAITGLKSEVETLRGLVDGVVQTLPKAIESAVDAEAKSLLQALDADLRAEWKTATDALLAKLPATQKALEDLAPFFEEGNQVLAGLDALPTNVGAAIPHPPDDLPPVELDLTRQPITPGDRLRLEVAFFDRAEYTNAEAAGKPAKPRELVTYTSDAIKSGWIWSGDVIFVKPIDGADHFEASAAVSYERHWRDRDDPKSWLNKLDPGVGFHAAALNFDPNESAEFGVGINASLFSGLLRVGYGYDISIDQDQEYWYFGFGLISALQQVKELGESAFGD